MKTKKKNAQNCFVAIGKKSNELAVFVTLKKK